MFVFFLFAFSFPHEHVCGDDPRWHVLNEEILDDHQRVHVCDVLLCWLELNSVGVLACLGPCNAAIAFSP